MTTYRRAASWRSRNFRMLTALDDRKPHEAYRFQERSARIMLQRMQGLAFSIAMLLSAGSPAAVVDRFEKATWCDGAASESAGWKAGSSPSSQDGQASKVKAVGMREDRYAPRPGTDAIGAPQTGKFELEHSPNGAANGEGCQAEPHAVR